jgi:hypothetical protein
VFVQTFAENFWGGKASWTTAPSSLRIAGIPADAEETELQRALQIFGSFITLSKASPLNPPESLAHWGAVR